MSDIPPIQDPNAPQMPQGYFDPNMQGQQQFFGYQNPQFQNFQQFPYGDPSGMMGPPPNMGPPYEFRRRINKMNWDMLSQIDVSTIAKTNDVQSIEFLMTPIAFANISMDDSEHFGSQACLHAFLLLQLSVEYLLFKLNTTPSPSFMQQNGFQQMPQQCPPPQQAQQNQMMTNYEARIDLLNKDIKTRDLLINSLSEKMRQAERERDALKAKLQMNTKESEQTNEISNELSDIPVKRNASRSRRRNDETGLIHQDSELQEYQDSKVRIKSRSKSRKSSTRSKHHRDDIYSYSYYDYSESDIIPPPKPKKKTKEIPKKAKTRTKNKTNVHLIDVSDDWDSSSPWN